MSRAQAQDRRPSGSVERIEPLTMDSLDTFLHRDLELIAAAIAPVARERLSALGLVEAALFAAKNNQKLLQCPYISILYGITLAARAGLPIGPPYRQSDLINRYSQALGNWCWWEPSYQGLRTLARRTGVVATFQSEVVYSSEKFEYAYGDDDFIRHQPGEKVDGALKYAYTITTFLNGARRTFTVMRADEVAHVMKSSESHDKDWSPWQKHPAEQWKKTCSKRHCKTLELSEELAIASQAIDHSEIHRIDPAILALAGNGQLALPPSTSEIIEAGMRDEYSREPVAVAPPARGAVSLASLRPSTAPNRGHGNEGFTRGSQGPAEQTSAASEPAPVPPPGPPPNVKTEQLERLKDGAHTPEVAAALETQAPAVPPPPPPQASPGPDDFIESAQARHLGTMADRWQLTDPEINEYLGWLGIEEFSVIPRRLHGRATTLLEVRYLLTRTKSTIDAALKHYRVREVRDLTDDQLKQCLAQLRAKASKDAQTQTRS